VNNYPYILQPHEPTRKQVWLEAFTALLSHMGPDEAIEAADRALILCDKKWAAPEWVGSWQYRHNYPVGHVFRESSAVTEGELGTPSAPL
jgi:hypothetical protein